ncbi:biopolymer transporter ExbD [Chitinispirillales bacterium ANBcel5]|uniref:ExbD/TolR family protein n=1 Tax=Cellulosispirillum alkaliphilum TaxID=3039283 RepID=UPI002A505B8C|nr:biopolymer transporter ExbD [Chitinispirillales bacterium ANBcel5]
MINHKKKGSFYTSKGCKPQLTSLIDVMVILLIYLLQSFSAEGEIMTVGPDLILPESSSELTPEAMTTVIVNNSFIMAENRKLTTVDKVLDSEDLIIPELSEWLRQRREISEKLGRVTGREFKGEITIQGDKRIPFDLLKRILYTCGYQNYNQFSLAVRKREE